MNAEPDAGLNADRLSFQLYSARNFPPLDDQLAFLAGLGFRNVEPYGGLFAEPDALHALLRRHDLRTPTAHLGIEGLRADAEAVARLAREFGIEQVIVPAVPADEQTGGAPTWTRLGKELAGFQEILAAESIGLAWHNHSYEFAVLPDGSYPLDHILAAAPGLGWQADIGWIEWAGENAAAWIEKYRDRVSAVHVKDLAPKGENADEDGQADVGYGVIDWRKLMPALRSPQLRYLVLEHDNPSDYRRFARRSLATVSRW